MLIAAFSAPVWEGAFWRDAFCRLRFPTGVDLEAVYGFLTAQVCRRPRRLELHVCRIRAAAALGEEALYAALLDLFWVLDAKGESLKRRLLTWGQGRLAADRRMALAECLAGRLAVRQLPFSPRAVLHDGVWGETELVVATAEESAGKDPLSVARLCLELGQLDQAREILAAQLKVEPHRAEFRQTLLEIYLATQDAKGFAQSALWLADAGYLDEAWRVAGRRLGVQI
ncbi:hypothetical protein JCM13664_14420 [Methylothermus subterraneus]